jgi:hypothetical protein
VLPSPKPCAVQVWKVWKVAPHLPAALLPCLTLRSLAGPRVLTQRSVLTQRPPVNEFIHSFIHSFIELDESNELIQFDSSSSMYSVQLTCAEPLPKRVERDMSELSGLAAVQE